jgi:transcriptional regulator with XRE-family HTH domain
LTRYAVTDIDREIRAWLKALRERAGLSQDALSSAIKRHSPGLPMSQGKVAKIESGGRARLDLPLIRAWVEVTGGDQAETQEMLDRYVQQLMQVRPSRAVQSIGLAERQREYATIQNDATAIWEFSPAGVPGLLQTPEYATYFMERLAGLTGNSRDVGQAVAERMNNQAVLYNRERSFHFVITEAALHYPVGPEPVRTAQAAKIVSLMDLPQVSIRVLLASASPAAPQLSAFMLYEIPEDPLVLVELLTSEATPVESLEDVQVYRDAFAELERHAIRSKRDNAKAVRALLGAAG